MSPSCTTGPARKWFDAATYENDMPTWLMVGVTVCDELEHMVARHWIDVPTEVLKVTHWSVVGAVVQATAATQVAPPSFDASQVVVVPVTEAGGVGEAR